MAAVIGMRGTGKTHLAAALARDDIDTGHGLVGWVNAGTIETALTGLAEIADRLGVADPQGDSAISARRLREHLSGSRETGLLIFDNADDPDRIRPLLPAAGRTMILITSTNRAFDQLGETVDLTGFTRSEAIHYLRGATKLADQDGAHALAAVLGDHPLALSTAAGTITGRHLTYARYQDLLDARSLPEILGRKAGQDYPRSVAQAILLSIDNIETLTDDPRLDAAVSRLIGVLAMLSPAGVRRDILLDPDDRLDEALERCEQASLLSWSTAADTVIMHRLTGRVLRERAESANATNELVAGALDLLEAHIFSEDRAWTRREEGAHLVDHIDALWGTRLPTRAADPMPARALRLRRWAVRQMITSANVTRSIPLGLETLTDHERVLGPDHPDTLVARNNLAYAYESAGQLAKAIHLYQATLTDCERVLGSDHPDTFSCRNNLASAYRFAGQIDKAIRLYETNLADSEPILGRDHPDLLVSHNNLALAYYAAGQLDKAIRSLELNLADCERILGLDHPRTFINRTNLAAIYASAGRVDKAVSALEGILTDSERILGPDHPDTLTTRNNLAQAYGSAGNLGKAIPLHRTTLTDSERVLGPDHPDTLIARNNLALAYRSAGRLDEATALFETTLTDSQRVLGPDHPTTLTARNNLALAYQSAGQVGKAIAALETTLADRERILGLDHPGTSISRNSLAFAYQAGGQLDKAIPLYETTLTDRLRLLGPDHPDTLVSRNNLAFAFQTGGQLGKAIPLFETTLTDSERVLGPNHPTTLTIRNNLARAHASEGRSAD
ncbi:tetratricopeptide repeat protein [Nocardia sp. NPDC006630]|uniref:tetratricopeptide repeat protein n=1 Tax=Nocardia sp. NPDC006630 TaxID=3157181 RepID=UPI0033BF4293